VRDDLSALEGYHSPQVHVRVRLNTNESPFPPPAAWRDAFAAELSRVEWHRYPDRSATALREGIAALHGVRADQVFAANGSNEVLQTLLLTFAGPGRTVATFEPTYQLHGHIARLTGATVVEGRLYTAARHEARHPPLHVGGLGHVRMVERDTRNRPGQQE
jgi:histidinol-phosphate aminotransferase